MRVLRQADPADARTRYDLGSCSITLGRADEALTELRAALENDPDVELTRSIHAAMRSAYRSRGTT